MPSKEGIAKNFNNVLETFGKSKESTLLKHIILTMKDITGYTMDELIHQLVISTLGCFYPNPPRIQEFAESVLLEFLQQNVYQTTKSIKDAKLFLTEGASAAIIYIFNSLKYNNLVVEGDEIGILTPIFSPYLEFPALKNYSLKQVCIKSDENDEWEIPEDEINKIKSKKMKALFIVNPTNPVGRSLSISSVNKIANIVEEHNKDLIVICDNVYAPFVEKFHSLIDEIPRNLICVYSFSKYFGTTGWRLGCIMIQNDNIIDNKLLGLQKNKVHDRYKIITTDTHSIPFIERLLIDSRQVAEAHTAGLSTPQQVIMCLFAMYDYLDKKRTYNQKLKSLLEMRIESLVKPLDYKLSYLPEDTNYYVVMNLLKVSENLYKDTAFNDYLQKHCDPLEFIYRLAKEYSTVVLPCVGFAGPFWAIRVSIANLPSDLYPIIGKNIRGLLDTYYTEYRNS
jgi:aspartate 4-decarboxylase